MKSAKRASRGQIIVVFGVACVALFAILSLAIDGGRILMDQRALQNLADGGALTAAADIGPGADATTSATAEDDAVYSIERALSISFSNNYTCPGPAWCAGGQSGVLGHRLQGGPCAPWACTPTTPGTNHGPWNASNVASPCCSNWTDSTGAYVLSITTPFTCCAAASEKEAFVLVRLTHHMPLVIGGSLWPTVDVTVMTVARNYAIPYAIFMFKHNEDKDIITNGATSMSATKRIGSNGTTSISNSSMTFLCATRLLAAWLVLPFMYLAGIGAAFLASYIAVVQQIGYVSSGGYFLIFWQFQNPPDFLYSLIKAMFMATAIVLVACYYGYNASGGPVGVGRATAKSMVLNLVLVHVIGMLGTQIFWGANPRAPIGG